RDEAGEPVMVIGTQTDITERKREQEALVRRDAVLAALGTAAQRFLLSAQPWREVVDDVLSAVGTAAGVDRVYLFENVGGEGPGVVSRQTHEWVAAGVPSFLGDPGLQAFRWEDFGVGDLAAALSRGEPVFRHRRALPQAFAALLADEGIESIALVPVFVERRFWGLVGFDQCDREREWEASERESLGMIAATLGAAIHEEAARLVLVESEARFRRLVEQTLVGIFIIDAERIRYANPRAAEILGGKPEDFVGRPFRELVSEADWPAVEPEIRLVMTGGISSGKVEFRSRRADGAEIVIGAQGIRIIHEGQPATMGVMQDISEKKRTEEQIRRYVLQLESAVKSTVGVAMALSELRDPYTAGHERRVAEIAVAIGREIGLDPDRLEGLRVAGQLHDVGKMTIPTEILAKPGRLSATEYELIKSHAQASYDVLKDVDFPWPVAEIARQHHERIDGSGYPQGLKGEAIMLEARIMAVADVVEAMSSHRPYRPGLGIDRALAEIERGMGTAYDDGAARACLALFREKGFAIPD
ncbi:MAG: GAF and HD-GYP domain-containing protein, partial [Burkholderiales bacterium]